MSAFDSLSSLDLQRIWEGVHGRAVHGERITLGLIELDPDSVVPEHSHELAIKRLSSFGQRQDAFLCASDFPSSPKSLDFALSVAGERTGQQTDRTYKQEVGGSIPSPPTELGSTRT
jgi:hypothetical protein